LAVIQQQASEKVKNSSIALGQRRHRPSRQAPAMIAAVISSTIRYCLVLMGIT
jgi:hypothetical protein